MSQTALSTGPRRVLVFGGSGQLGAPLLKELGRRQAQAPQKLESELRTVRWREVANLSVEALRDRLEQDLRGARACDIVFANGLTDPTLTAEQLLFSNFEFVQRVTRVLESGDRDLRFLTLGTIMERFPEACAKNPYLRSKLLLGQWMASRESPGFLHVRLHTVYGSVPKKHMFLGQMVNALASNTVLEMSSGEQLREYHHADDVAVSLAQVLGRAWDSDSWLEINSGAPLRLVDLARGVFGAFEKLTLLKVGAISGALGDNSKQIFERSEPWLLPVSREPLAGVVALIKQYLK